MGTQNRKIDEGETTQWPKEEVQKDKSDLQNSAQSTKDRVTPTPLKPGVTSGAPER
jgi:hypothetical protein